ELTALLLEKLNRIPQVKILGSSDPEAVEKRVGAVSFTVEGVPHSLVAAVLSYEWGIAICNGTFCAQPLMKHLLKTDEDFICGSKSENATISSGNASGAVRASLGLHNTEKDIETLVKAVTCIAQKQWKGDYEQDAATGEYLPRDFRFDFSLLPGFSTEPISHCPASTPTRQRRLSLINRLPLVTAAGVGALVTTFWACFW
ncbi:MAG TPA: aminotransferase class V-fold PLP-dependent enzyme, partial [Oculatellaceae cyanobacterium]